MAPPYYPHPTYHHKYPSQDVNNPYSPSTPVSSAPHPTDGAQPLPSDPSQPDYQAYFSSLIIESYKHPSVHSSSTSERKEDSSQAHPDLQQWQETPASGLSGGQSAAHSSSSDTEVPVQTGVPPLQPPTHAFSQYYHYYHHPKIPLPDPPDDPDPAVQVVPEINSHIPNSAELPLSIHHSDQNRPNLDQFFKPGSESSSPPSAPSANTPEMFYLPQPYPYHFYSYFPYFAKGEAKTLILHNSETDVKPDFSAHENMKLTTSAHSESSDIDANNNLHPQPDEMTPPQINSPDFKHLVSASDGVAEEEPPKPDTVRDEPHAFPNLQPSYYLPPYPYYYFLYYPYYQKYEPESFHGASSRLSSTLSKDPSKPSPEAASSSLPHSSFHKPQTTILPTKPVYDTSHVPVLPYFYYYHPYYRPKTNEDKQEVHSAGLMNSKSESHPSSASDHSEGVLWPHAAGASSNLDPDVSEELHYKPVEHQDGKAVEERLDHEMNGK